MDGCDDGIVGLVGRQEKRVERVTLWSRRLDHENEAGEHRRSDWRLTMAMTKAWNRCVALRQSGKNKKRCDTAAKYDCEILGSMRKHGNEK